MRCSSSFSAFSLALAIAAIPAAVATADQVVLKDGSVITTSRPYVVKGNQALLRMPDGTLTSIALSSIDVAKTAAANMKAAPAPTPAPAIAPPLTPAQAAKQKRKKATVVLSDDAVLHPIEGGGEEGQQQEGGGSVEVTNVTTERGDAGYSITGSVVNSGEGTATGISVSVEGVGEGGKAVTTVFGQLAKDNLGPGEKTTFTAQMNEPSVSSFRFIPRWQVRAPARSVSPSAPAEMGEEANPLPTPAAPAAAPPAAPAPATRTEITPVPRADVAAPPANPPVGTSNDSNSGYIPGYTDDGQVPQAQPQPQPSAPPSR